MTRRRSPGDGSTGDAEDVTRRAETEVILRAQAGDESAFKELVETYQRLAYVWAREKVSNHEDALDVAQEAFVRVFRSLHRFDPERRFTTWLYRIVSNLAIDCLRRRRSSRLTSGLEEMPEVVARDADSWLEHEMRQHDIDQVYNCLDRLPPKYREIIILRDIEDIPAKEIAERVGLTHATVRWRLHQGRKLFKEVWERIVLERDTELETRR